MKVLVTGGAGFIGSAVIRQMIADGRHQVVNLDKLTYAANLSSLGDATASPDYSFEQVDVVDQAAVRRVLYEHRPDAVMHLAAESHVDRSIDGPAAFIETNVLGTYVLIDAVLDYFRELTPGKQLEFRFHHVSTDEVFGALSVDSPPFSPETAYDPRSPYSASKAASDHLVSAWHHTYGLPVVLSNCSNNYGPYQFPEKLIPLVIINALEGKPLPVYGKGENIRDWLHVEDHADALIEILERGRIGENYLVGGDAQFRNIDVVEMICGFLDELLPESPHRPHSRLITFVEDRPGHDFRYAIDASKISDELGWRPAHTFDEGLRATVRWYLDNEPWWRDIQTGRYAGERLGLERKTKTQ